jgi:hypothetical protein
MRILLLERLGVERVQLLRAIEPVYAQIGSSPARQPEACSYRANTPWMKGHSAIETRFSKGIRCKCSF